VEVSASRFGSFTRYLMHKRLSSPLHFLLIATFLQLNSLRRFEFFKSWRPITYFPVLSLVQRLKKSGPVPPFCHTPSWLIQWHCTCTVFVLCSLWKTCAAVWQRNWKLCSSALIDTAAISWRFVTWHLMAYYSSVRPSGNHAGSFCEKKIQINNSALCMNIHFKPDSTQCASASKTRLCVCVGK
jgi:hypothetical protein